MSKAKVFPFLGVGFVLTFTAFLILVAAPFYSYYESSYYYGDYVVNATIFNVSTVFGVFGIIIFILTAIAFIACLANVKYGGSKGPGVFLIVCVIFEILYGLVLFFYSIGLYNYTMTGGIVYIVFSILAHIFSLIAASNFIRLTNYVPSRPVKRATPTSVVGTSSSSSYSSSYSPSGASRVIKFPTETELDDVYTFEFYGTNVTVRIIDKNTKTVNTQTFFYNTPIACSTTVSEDCFFFGFKTKSSSSYSSYSGPFKEVTIKLNNIKGITSAKEMFSGVKESNSEALRLYDEWFMILDKFVKLIVNSYMPDIICMTGGLMKAKDVFFEKLQKANPDVNIVECHFKEEAGRIGAAVYAFKMMKAI